MNIYADIVTYIERDTNTLESVIIPSEPNGG